MNKNRIVIVWSHFGTDMLLSGGSVRVNCGTNMQHAAVILPSKALKYFIIAFHGDKA